MGALPAPTAVPLEAGASGNEVVAGVAIEEEEGGEVVVVMETAVLMRKVDRLRCQCGAASVRLMRLMRRCQWRWLQAHLRRLQQRTKAGRHTTQLSSTQCGLMGNRAQRQETTVDTQIFGRATELP